MTRWILVVEDERPLGEMIVDNLSLESYGAELVRSGKDALDRLERRGVDLVILDIMLPELDGFEVLRRIRARGDNTPVLVLSARASDDDRIRGLELQADDYLTKPFNLRELLLRVDALLRRQPAPPVGADTVRFGDNEVDFRTMRARNFRGEDIELTATEIRLLRLLTARAGTVVRRREMVEHLFGPGTPMTIRTLDNVALRLRKLFEEDTRNPRWFHTVRGVGLRFQAEGHPAERNPARRGRMDS